VLRRISRPKSDEVTGELRKVHNGEFHNLYSSPDTVRQIKSTRMRWVGHVERIGEEKRVQGFDGKAQRRETTCKPKA
jgi:hypothetical protein